MDKLLFESTKPTQRWEVKIFLTLLISLPLIFVLLYALENKSATPQQALNFPDANYSNIIWVDNKLAAFTFDIYAPELQFAIEGTSSFSNIDLPDDPGCSYSTKHYVVETFSDGRIQIKKTCITVPRTRTYIMAYDWFTKKLEQIAGPLPLGSDVIHWNPDMTKGIVELHNAISSGTLYSIWQDGFGPLDIAITDEDKSWNLSNFYPDFPDSAQLQTGDVDRADWSTDGKFIAFFASSEAIGKLDFDRFYVEYKIFIMDANFSNPRVILDNIFFPHIIEWSPDSKYIAFIGEYGNNRQEGIWLFSVENNSITSIDQGEFQDVLWGNKNSNSIFAIKCNGHLNCKEIIEYKLNDLINVKKK